MRGGGEAGGSGDSHHVVYVRTHALACTITMQRNGVSLPMYRTVHAHRQTPWSR